jgi:hypothetical protein
MNVLSLHTKVPFPTGIFSMGRNIVTAGGLILQGRHADDYLRALDVHGGEELWKGRLAAGGPATPITYIGAGREYVVIAAEGTAACAPAAAMLWRRLPSPLNSIGRLSRRGTVGGHLEELEGIVLTVAAVCTGVHGKSVTPLMQWCRAAIR